MPDTKEITVTLSPATAHMVTAMYEESRKREEKESRYLKSAAAYVEALLDYAIQRKSSEWKSRDKQAVGKVLREALDKLVNDKPLSLNEATLVAQFKAACAKEEPEPVEA